jgi:regulator of sigma E protease
MDVVYFVVLVGVLIFVHELGHFAWAKFFGVRVLRFSLGFGPRLAGFRVGETEYVIGAFPIGGYVKMLGESPHDVIAPADEGRSFQAQSLFRRTLIVLAGPCMNLLFPLVLFFLVSAGDDHLLPPVIGTVLPGMPADGRLLPGDRILAIDDEEVGTYDDLNRIVRENPGRPLEMRIERRGEEVTEIVTPVIHRTLLELDRERVAGVVGVYPNQPTPVVGVLPGSPAAAAEMRTFDLIVAVQGHRVDRFVDLEERLDSQSMVGVAYLRPTPVEEPLGGLVSLDVYEPRFAMLTPTPGHGAALQRAGVESADAYVSFVGRGSPEDRANIRPGDRILTLDGEPVRLWSSMVDRLRQSPGGEHVLTFRRGGEFFEARLRLALERGRTERGQIRDHYQLRMSNWVPTYMEPHVPNERVLAYAAREAWTQIGEMVELTVYSVVRLVQGRIPVSAIGGPLMIFDVAGTAAREGAVNYLKLMGFTSVNLGLINLLPIPLLDGGHLLFFLVETVKRRPIGTRAREWASLAGFVFLVLIMLLAFKNDLERRSGQDRFWPELGAEIGD